MFSLSRNFSLTWCFLGNIRTRKEMKEWYNGITESQSQFRERVGWLPSPTTTTRWATTWFYNLYSLTVFLKTHTQTIQNEHIFRGQNFTPSFHSIVLSDVHYAFLPAFSLCFTCYSVFLVQLFMILFRIQAKLSLSSLIIAWAVFCIENRKQ